jgi:hypothetical protein
VMLSKDASEQFGQAVSNCNTLALSMMAHTKYIHRSVS